MHSPYKRVVFDGMRAHFAVRVWIILGAIVVFALVLVARLYFVQVVYGNEFRAQADRQYVQPGQHLYDRGSIFFRDKDGRLISAATLRSGFKLAVNPREVTDPGQAYRSLASAVELDKDTFYTRARKDDPYEEIAHRLDEDVANKIEEYSVPGVHLYRERWRYYPGDELAAHAVGFVGFRGSDYAGRYGLERYYDDVLSRESSNVYVNFFAEIFAGLGSVIFQGGGHRAGDIITSIEPSVQLFLEEQLRDIHETWSARQVGGVIMNPQNGDIYALGVYPTFSLNDFGSESNEAVFGNPLVENVFELGSIIKPLTIAAGLDSGAVSAQTTYVDRGSVSFDGYTISNFDGKARGRVVLQEVLNQSLNTGAAFVMQTMGKDTFRAYMLERYRIGEETGIDLPSESAGIVGNLKSPRDIEYATASFGQGIAMTPIATVRALASLAGGGTLVTPHVAQEIRYENGLSKEISFKEGEQVLKPETSEEITRMLVEVVDDALLGGTVRFPRYSVAAKTGTAQIAKAGERGYYDDRFLHSFFGYFPAYDAQFLIFLYALEPQGVRYASQTLTHPFIDSADFLINYYDVPPDR